jgi:Bacterial Ig-like domain (group 3)
VSGTGTPTGTITFSDGGAFIQSAMLSGGSVCITTTSLSVGTHSITASYSGDAQFYSSVSSAVTVIVGVYGADVAGAPSSSTGGPPSANTGATGNASGAGASAQQSQSATSSGSGVVASSTSTGTQPVVSGIWPAGLGLGLGALLLLVGLSGLGIVLMRAAKR